MKIERKSFSGMGVGYAPIAGWPYVRLTGKVEAIGYARGGNEHYVHFLPRGAEFIYFSPDNNNPVSIMTGSPYDAWRFDVSNVAPSSLDQSAAQFSILDNGQVAVTGDEDVIYRGQDVDLNTVSIAGIRVNMDELAKLYHAAALSKSATDAARYLKFKAAVEAIIR
ncbi:hypothetical protein [Paenibacillus sp. Leaf72]|uniref:hypothetical protein n=1 Tax=Paenibacillus sp. Leaf72 TaxID=1736234 RepID=UPI0006F60FDE|nr:hypothetical protein [Paenibacillus sp. Leaf72]KQN97585.1 hypothetical protein ASF12_20445 [Paenibacillus sp. Leaf72]